MTGFDLIIFDCDGVLVDSERIANEVFARILNESCGLRLSLDDMFRIFVGHSSEQCMRIVEDMLGDKPPAGLEKRYKDEIEHALASSVTPVEGIEKALADISIPYCVASSGSYEKMRITLGKANLLHLFENVLNSTSDVPEGKPAPDIYLHAARKMGIFDFSRCLVIEDSAIGVEGAVKAGMTVFGYCELTGKNKLVWAGAHHTFDNMACLAEEMHRYTFSLI